MTEAVCVASQAEPVSAWERFWFCCEPNAGSLRTVRIGLSLIAYWYFFSHWADVDLWFSSVGMLATESLGKLIEADDLVDQYKWRLSPLYWIESTVALRVYLAVGFGLASVASLHRTSRIPSALLWLWCVWLANRSVVIAGPEELVIVFGLAYLAIASPGDPLHWTTAFARRLLQVHTALLIGITGLTMLASTIWWDGAGSMSAAAPVGRRMLDLTGLLSTIWFRELLSHAVVLTAIFAPIGIWFNPTRRAAYIVLMCWTIVVALLSSQWMYMMALAVLLQSFSSALPLRFRK